MFKKYKKIVLLSAVLIIISAASIAFANIDINEADRTEISRRLSLMKHEEEISEFMAKSYNLTAEEFAAIKNSEGTLEKAMSYLIEKSYRFDEEMARNLYDMGYSINDISKAEELSIQSGYKPFEIIIQKNDHNTWDDVISAMNIDTRPLAVKKGMTEEMYESYKNQGISDKDLAKISIMASENKKDVLTVASLVIEKGENKAREALEGNNADDHLTISNKMLEDKFIEVYKITDEELLLMKSKGIEGFKLGEAIRTLREKDIPVKEALEIEEEVNEDETETE